MKTKTTKKQIMRNTVLQVSEKPVFLKECELKLNQEL